jgi:hypothetical protein
MVALLLILSPLLRALLLGPWTLPAILVYILAAWRSRRVVLAVGAGLLTEVIILAMFALI